MVMWTEGESEWPPDARTFGEAPGVNEVTPKREERQHSKGPQGYKQQLALTGTVEMGSACLQGD